MVISHEQDNFLKILILRIKLHFVIMIKTIKLFRKPRVYLNKQKQVWTWILQLMHNLIVDFDRRCWTDPGPSFFTTETFYRPKFYPKLTSLWMVSHSMFCLAKKVFKFLLNRLVTSYYNWVNFRELLKQKILLNHFLPSRN